jgi:aminoglycoside phosphotransferase family enzyme
MVGSPKSIGAGSPAIHQVQLARAIHSGSALGLRAHEVDALKPTAISMLGATKCPPRGPARAAAYGYDGDIFVKVPRADPSVFDYAFQAVGGRRDLEARRALVEAEFAKNLPSAPSVYLGPAPFRAQFTPEGTLIDGSIVMSANQADGKIIDWGLVMTRLQPEQNLGYMLQEGHDVSDHLRKLVTAISEMHQRTAPLHQDEPEAHYAAVHAMYSTMITEQMGPAAASADFELDLDLLIDLNRRALEACRETIIEHCKAGNVGNHHADLHKDNLWIVEGAAVLLDGIAFNNIFAVIDRWQDLAYLIADLKNQDRADLAESVLNQYLKEMGDKPNEDMMNLYIASRLLVRSFLDLIDLADITGTAERANQIAVIQNGIRLAVKHFRKIVG